MPARRLEARWKPGDPVPEYASRETLCLIAESVVGISFTPEVLKKWRDDIPFFKVGLRSYCRTEPALAFLRQQMAGAEQALNSQILNRGERSHG